MGRGFQRQSVAADMGQNVVQIVGFEDDDWTGSVLKGELTLRSFVGMWEYGRRF